MLLFDFHPTPLFSAGIVITATSVWLYARPDDVSTLSALALARLRKAMRGGRDPSIAATMEADPAYFHEGKLNGEAAVRQDC